jgi:DNA-binding NarL/FixJ family response regulator
VTESIRVLIVDDHPLVLSGLRALLASESAMIVVGEAADGAEAISRALELEPDVILMDLHMAQINGIEATRQILRAQPRIGVLALTMLEDDDTVFAAMRAGARGYLLKGADEAVVLRAIHAVAHGEAIFSPAIAGRLIQFFSAVHPVAPAYLLPELTERERQILGMIAHGMSNAQIADELTLSPKTVSNHVSNIFTKLQVVDRAQAVLRAQQAGIE